MCFRMAGKKEASITFAHCHAIVVIFRMNPIQSNRMYILQRSTFSVRLYYCFGSCTISSKYRLTEHNVKVIAYKSGLRFVLFV